MIKFLFFLIYKIWMSIDSSIQCIKSWFELFIQRPWMNFLVTLPQTLPAALGMTTTPEFRSAFLAKTTRSGHHGGSRSTLLGAHGGSRSTRLSLPSTPRNILNCRVRLLDGRDFDVQLPVRDYLPMKNNSMAFARESFFSNYFSRNGY